MNRSPLHDLHQRLGARFVDFGGWEMPVQYGSVLAEHRAVRGSAGWFDVTHLGRFELTGSGAEPALLRLLSNDITGIAPGGTQYTHARRPQELSTTSSSGGGSRIGTGYSPTPPIIIG